MKNAYEVTLQERINTLLGTGLTEKVSIYVPSTTQASKEATALQVLMTDFVSEQMAKMFGGFTRHEAIGGWVSEVEGLISENVTVVSAMASKIDLHDNLEKVVLIAEYVKSEMSQEAVSVEVNGTLFFV